MLTPKPRRTERAVLISLALAGALLVSASPPPVACCRPSARLSPVAQSAPAALPLTARATAKDDTEAAKQAILANVKGYMDAFNSQDAKAVLTLFTNDCEIIENDGTPVHGLKELADELKESFAANPKAKISVGVDSVRFLTNDVAIEEGKTTFYPDGQTLTAETQYQVTHVKKGDRWLMSHARSFDRKVLSPYDRLRDLEFLVGDWVDEGGDSLVESSYRWDANKTFLLQDFTIRVKGRDVLKGTQRIGWDPLAKQIKGWVFDSEGGYAESLWNDVDEDGWILKAKGVTSEGKVVTMTNQLKPLGKDRVAYESRDRIVDEGLQPNVSTVIVRRPPAAAR